MKKYIVLFCMIMIVAIFSGCSQEGYLAKETTVNNDSFNKDAFVGNTYDITYQLTKKQQENFASAGYNILCSVKGVEYMDESEDARVDDIYMIVYGGRNVELDENGVLHGYYGKESLYAYNETEKSYTRIPLIVTEDNNQVEGEIKYVCPAIISNYKTAPHMGRWKLKSVNMEIVVNEEYPDGIISGVISKEEDEEYDLDEFDLIEIATYARYFTRGRNGEMIDFFEWEKTETVLGLSMDLTQGYHLEMKPIDDLEHYYCLFFIKDVNGNMTYSELIPLQK